MYSQIDSNKRKTVFLIMIFLIMIIALGWLLGVYLDYGYGVFLFAVLFSIGSSLISYYHGDKVALRSTKAKLIKKEEFTPILIQ